MKRYMLDTNVVSHFLKGHAALDERMRAVPVAALCVSAITVGELLYGLARRPEATRLHHAVRELLRRLDALAWDDRSAERYGRVRAGLERQGRSLSDLDLLIAAHALEAGVVLVTNDRAFDQVEGLPVEDWTVA